MDTRLTRFVLDTRLVLEVLYGKHESAYSEERPQLGLLNDVKAAAHPSETSRDVLCWTVYAP